MLRLEFRRAPCVSEGSVIFGGSRLCVKQQECDHDTMFVAHQPQHMMFSEHDQQHDMPFRHIWCFLDGHCHVFEFAELWTSTPKFQGFVDDLHNKEPQL